MVGRSTVVVRLFFYLLFLFFYLFISIFYSCRHWSLQWLVVSSCSSGYAFSLFIWSAQTKDGNRKNNRSISRDRIEFLRCATNRRIDRKRRTSWWVDFPTGSPVESFDSWNWTTDTGNQHAPWFRAAVDRPTAVNSTRRNSFNCIGHIHCQWMALPLARRR